jgi:hypothetical protein
MSVLFNVVNFLSFLSGTVFGLFLCFIVVAHYLGEHNKIKTLPASSSSSQSSDKEAESSVVVHGSYVPQKLSKQEASHLAQIIDFLDEMNSPLKNMSAVLERIHRNKDQELSALETKMKNIIELPMVTRLEKEFQDAISQLKDHSKQIKLISNFLHDLGKVFTSFSRDVSRLSHTARNNMNKGFAHGSLDRKEDMICNNWWQTLNIALDSMANDQEDLATIINEELISYSSQIQEEIAIIEKRLAAEGGRHFALIRENISLWETRLKERDKAKEKLRNTPIQSSVSSVASVISSNSSSGGASESYQR